jgi:hypothetical protein
MAGVAEGDETSMAVTGQRVELVEMARDPVPPACDDGDLTFARMVRLGAAMTFPSKRLAGPSTDSW